MIRYYKLFDLLNRRNMKKTDLLEVVSAPTLAKIGKGKNIQTDAIDKICIFLNCQPSDIMEVILEESEQKQEKYKIYKKPIIGEHETENKIYEFNDTEIIETSDADAKEKIFCQEAEVTKV